MLTTASNRFRLPSLLAFPLAALFAAASLGNITLPGTYAREAPAWAAQGLGQDWVDLLVVAPLLAASAAFALRGSRVFTLLLGGCLAYTGYSLTLYAFAMHFNALFLAYTLGLGLSFYGILAIASAFGREDVASWFAPAAPLRLAGGFSVLLGTLFYALWLAEIVPALLSGEMPASAVEAGLITNPVHVLDVGIVLPAFIAGGIALIRRRAFGYWLVPVMLAFGVVMDLAIIAMVVSMSARGTGGGAPIGVLVGMTVCCAVVVWLLLRSLAPAGGESATRRTAP